MMKRVASRKFVDLKKIELNHICLLIVIVSVAFLFACPTQKENVDNGKKTNEDAASTHDSSGVELTFKQVIAIDGSSTDSGRFTDIRAIASTNDSIFVADREFAQVLQFSNDGELLKTIGSGLRCKDFKLNDEDLYDTHSKYDEHLSNELANEIALHRFFCIEDLDIESGHLYVLNSFFTSLTVDKALGPAIFEFTLQGKFVEKHVIDQTLQPSRLDFTDSIQYIMSDSIYDDVIIAQKGKTETYINKKIITNVRTYYSEILKNIDNPAELSALRTKFSNQGMRKENYREIGGVALYTPIIDGRLDPDSTKAIVCDAGNSRIKILDVSGNILKILTSDSVDGVTLLKPIDVSVDKKGNMFVLDSESKSVVVIDKTFEYVGVVNSSDFVEPVSVDVNNSGKVWVVDKGAAKVFGFEQQ